MTDPSATTVRDLLNIPEEALPDAKFKTILTIVKRAVTSTDEDLLTYAVCYKLAVAGSWNYVTRMGDKSFSPPDPMPWKQEYLARCNQLGLKAELLGRPALQKVNSDLDDDDDLNEA